MDKPEFKKSSFSAYNGNCVEVAFPVKADFMGDVVVEALENGNVVMKATKSDKQLTFTPGEWEAFVKGVLDGEFDIPW